MLSKQVLAPTHAAILISVETNPEAQVGLAQNPLADPIA